jgi:hypothetical protein
MFSLDKWRSDISKEEYANPEALWGRIQQVAKYDALVATVLTMSQLASMSREHIVLALVNILIDDRKHLLRMLIEAKQKEISPSIINKEDL